MIDLHTHTTASDGTLTPGQVIEASTRIGLEALSITDHDTFAGFDAAAPLAREAGLPLICGIELSTKLGRPYYPKPKTIHLLGYFFNGQPDAEFRVWLAELQASRRDRNRRLADRLRSMGIDIRLEEVEARGRTMAGRPHFAQLMVEKGYVKSIQQAFDEYLDESAKAYVERQEPGLAEGLRRILAADGLPSLAHPLRLGRRAQQQEEDIIRHMCKLGLAAIEAYHPDHSPHDTERYALMARRYRMAVSGGSDFHGGTKPGVEIGTGKDGNLAISSKVLDRLRSLVRR